MISVILNQAAGSVGEDLAAKVRQEFAAAGLEVEVRHPEEGEDLVSLGKRAAQGNEDLVVAGGGDGTISAIAGTLVDTGKTLGVLPLGTLNHFAKDLGIPLELPAAVAAIVHGRTMEVDVGEVSGRVFINNSSLGLYPRIVATREAQQERLSRSKWTAFAWSTLRTFRRFPFLQLRLTVNGKQLVRRTAFLFVGNNEYEIDGFNLGARSCLDAGNLGLYLTPRTGRLGLFLLGLRALFGRVRQAKDFEAFCVDEVTIESHKPKLLVATDGEVGMMETPLRYRIRPGALRVKVPAKNDAPADK